MFYKATAIVFDYKWNLRNTSQDDKDYEETLSKVKSLFRKLDMPQEFSQNLSLGYKISYFLLIRIWQTQRYIYVQQIC